MAEGVTGRVEEKILPVMKTPLAVAAIAEDDMRPLPVKVRKMGLRLASNLATKELVEPLATAGKAAPEVAIRLPELVVPVT